MKIINLFMVVVFALLLAGCQRPVNVPDSYYGMEVDFSDGVQYDQIYSGNSMLLGKCMNECDSALLIERSIETKQYTTEFIVKRSDVSLSMSYFITYKIKDGKEYIKQAVEIYPQTTGSGFGGDNTKVRVITNEVMEQKSIQPYTNSVIRDTINYSKGSDGEIGMTIDDVMDNLSELREVVLQSLKSSVKNTPVEIVDFQFDNPTWPEKIREKKERLVAVHTEELIQVEELQRDMRLEEQQQTLRKIKANNSIKIDEIYKPHLDDKMVTWQMLEVLDTCASNPNGCSLIIGDEMMPLRGKK